jgi:DNA-binding MarR family transcriptional regulator
MQSISWGWGGRATRGTDRDLRCPIEIYDAGFDLSRELREQAAFWRSFNRYYFNRLRGLRSVNAGYGFHPTELRVLREIGEAEDGVCGAYIAWKANVDAGQVSRIVGFFRHLGWIEDRVNPRDHRIKDFVLTQIGRDTFRGLDRRAHDATEFFLVHMMREDRMRLVAALSEVQGILAEVPHKC